jgi:hypothetical protein
MTVQRNEEVKCPRCQGVSPMEIYYTINATLNPIAKRMLLEGNVNVIHCADCGLDAAMAIDLLYHDMEREFLARFVPADWIEDVGYMTRFDSEGREPVRSRNDSEVPDYFNNVHVVFSLKELVNYIRFRDRLWMWRLKRTKPTLTSRQPD